MSALDVGAVTKGWLHDAEADALYRYGLASDGPFVELGTYCGKSACYLGQAAAERDTVLFTVDHHRGSPEMDEGAACHDPDVVVDGRHDTLPFLRSTLRTAGLENVVFPIVAPTTVGACLRVECGLLFIDAAHDAVGVANDYDLWAPNVRPGGFLLFHDATIRHIGLTVDRAIGDGFELVESVASLRVLVR